VILAAPDASGDAPRGPGWKLALGVNPEHFGRLAI